MDDRFVIIDGSSLVHRAFYAIPLLTNKAGAFTNAAYGFTNIILRIIEQIEPKYLAVAFDKGRITFRNDMYKEYKGHRKATPSELKPQFAIIHRILDALGVSYYELANYEADDIIGTFAKVGESEGTDNIIVTGDKDALQLVSEKTVVHLTRKGISEVDIYDLEKIKNDYKLSPNQIIDLKGLMGDASDNIPGVPSVGEKTALKLLWQYHSVEEVYDNLALVSGAKLKENLKNNKELAYISKNLATIDCNVPMDFNLQECLYTGPDHQKLLEVFSELEFKSLVNKVLADMEPNKQTIQNKVDFDSFVKLLDLDKPISMILELTIIEGKHELKLASLVSEDISTCVLPPQFEDLLGFLKSNSKAYLIVHDYKETYKFLKQQGIKLLNVDDVLIGAYLLNPTASYYGIEELALEYLNIALAKGDDPQSSLIKKTEVLSKLHAEVSKQLKAMNMGYLYKEVELPLVSVLAEMELSGIMIDVAILEEMGEEIDQRVEGLAQDIYELTGERFNINSPKQLGNILFEKMDLPVQKKTKTGYSTDASVLEQLARIHPIGNKLLEYRQFTKLKGTYVDGFKGLIDTDTNRIHTTYKQFVTATGRLSSVEPNLQNIPIRLEEGRALRKAFVPGDPDKFLLACDYSQIELRILAHLSRDENLLDAFDRGHDIHTRTAAEVFGVEMEKVTPDLRQSAKAVNFGIVYGISDFGLSRDLGISRKEAKSYIDQYFVRYKGVKQYIENTISLAREQGYVTTIMNRRRYLPDLFSPNKQIRAFGERAAMNTPIQGSAADIIKMAMLKCQNVILTETLPITMLLQVHDELIFEVPKAKVKEAAKLMAKCMEDAYNLLAPLVVDVKAGQSWYDMKGVF